MFGYDCVNSVNFSLKCLFHTDHWVWGVCQEGQGNWRAVEENGKRKNYARGPRLDISPKS